MNESLFLFVYLLSKITCFSARLRQGEQVELMLYAIG